MHACMQGIQRFFRETAAVYNGRVVGIPYSSNVFMMYYRRDILSGLGLELPRTWDEVSTVSLVIRFVSGS